MCGTPCGSVPTNYNASYSNKFHIHCSEFSRNAASFASVISAENKKLGIHIKLENTIYFNLFIEGYMYYHIFRKCSK